MGPHEVVVPVFFFLTVGAIFGFVVLSRHKERMIMIEKGYKAEDVKAMYQRGEFRSPSPLSSLKWGLILVCIGVAVILGMYLHATYGVQEGIYPALMSLLGGVGLIVFYFIAKRKVTQ